MIGILVAGYGTLSLTGCGEIQGPKSAEDLLTHPFGTQGPFKRGTTKAEVVADWGNPKHIVPHQVDELGVAREEWIYEGWLPGLPIDHEYVSRTKHLFFEGDHLVRWETEELPGKSQTPQK
ncbi:MAG: hypothetical protein HYZ90_06055 [Candidatus Omnitrophica bacterium]|nr:hypothetical protein [Candidatus Omnitrophota bacterium]